MRTYAVNPRTQLFPLRCRHLFVDLSFALLHIIQSAYFIVLVPSPDYPAARADLCHALYRIPDIALNLMEICGLIAILTASVTISIVAMPCCILPILIMCKNTWYIAPRTRDANYCNLSSTLPREKKTTYLHLNIASLEELWCQIPTNGLVTGSSSAPFVSTLAIYKGGASLDLPSASIPTMYPSTPLGC